MVVGANTNSRPGPSSQKRKKHVKPAVKTLVDLRHPARKTDLTRSSYASEESDSDGTPPPSILVALARAGKKLKDKEKGKGRVKGKGQDISTKQCSKFIRCTDVIELSDSESSINHRPKKRAKTSALQTQEDVIDLCSDEDKQLGTGLTKDDILVLSSDDEQITDPPESSPPLVSSPARGKKKTTPAQLQHLSSPPPQKSRLVHSPSKDKNPFQQAPPSNTLLRGSCSTTGKRKRLTQQDFISAFNSSRETSRPSPISPLTSRFTSRVSAQKKYNIKYSDDCVTSPLLTHALFSRTIATMKAPTLHNQHKILRTKPHAIDLSAPCSDTKLQPTDDQGSSTQVIAEALLTTHSQTGDAAKPKPHSEPSPQKMMNIDPGIQGSPSKPHPSPSLYPRLPEADILPLDRPAVSGGNQEAFIDLRVVSSIKSWRQRSQLRRSLSVLRLDASELTASIILDSTTEDDGDSDHSSLSDLELGYPEPEKQDP